jgi:hypothetical protein
MTAIPPPPIIAPPAPRRRDRGWWWKIPVGLVVVALLFAVFLALTYEEIIKRFIAKRITDSTGMPTTITKLEIRPSKPAVHVKGFRMDNPPEFGGQTFLSIPEFLVSLDREALRENKLHLYVVRLDIGEINIVVNRAGQTNFHELRRRAEAEQKRATGRTGDTNALQRELPEFAGIDRFELKFHTLRYTDLRDPDYNRTVSIGLTNLVVENAKTREEFGVKFLLAALSSGIDVLNLFQGGIENLPRNDRDSTPPARK